MAQSLLYFGQTPREHFMKPFFALTTAAILLCACGDAEEHTGRIVHGISENYHHTADKIDEWTTATPKKQKHEVPASYCYQALQDILCYRQPMPGWEDRLVGYQGTRAAAPPVAKTKPLATRAEDNSMLPANRAKTAKPLVPGVKAAPKAAPVDPTAVPEAARETLPDPLQSPQL